MSIEQAQQDPNHNYKPKQNNNPDTDSEQDQDQDQEQEQEQDSEIIMDAHLEKDAENTEDAAEEGVEAEEELTEVEDFDEANAAEEEEVEEEDEEEDDDDDEEEDDDVEEDEDDDDDEDDDLEEEEEDDDDEEEDVEEDEDDDDEDDDLEEEEDDAGDGDDDGDGEEEEAYNAEDVEEGDGQAAEDESPEEDAKVSEGAVVEKEERENEGEGEDEDAKAAASKPKAKRKKKTGKGAQAEPQKPVTVLHMVFDEAGGQQIKQSFELDPEISGEIIFIADNYSLGPVADLHEPEGWQQRKLWWQSVLGLPEDEQPEIMSSDKMKMHQLLQQLEDEDTALWIWMGQNERDVAGYFHVISQLMAFQGRIHVLYLNNLPFIDEKGHIFYPRQLAEILPKEFVKASRLARVVTLSEFELDPEEWDKLSKQPGAVRLLEGGKKLSLKENDYYDKIILDQLGTAAMKLPRLLSQLGTKAKLGLPEYYIVWRIKSLIESGQIVSQGDFEKGIKNISLKATQGQMFVQLDPEETTGEPETESGD